MSEELHQSFGGWDDDEVITQQVAYDDVVDQVEESTRIADPVAIQREAEARMSPDDILKARLLSGTGARVGRFNVVRQLDEGGMGLVFVARDEELDREVALKILRAQQSEGSLGRARLVREAQALAKLAHPNVVTVFEVGEWEGHVFVAMELIHGRTLRGWLKIKKRRWREIVDVLLQAGRGLAAAHKVGIIHRDFKPSNVLVGQDGRVRVLDFGLALAPGAPNLDRGLPVAGSSSIVSGASHSLLGEALTMAGAIAGTPAYMAPEQLHGADVDVRCDVYAFSVTLFEALYGRRPYKGKSVDDRKRELASDAQVDFSGAKVPAWIRKILRRGLEVDPDRRYASMLGLLAELEHDPTKKRRWIVGGSLAALVLLGGGYGIARQQAAMNDPCADVGDEIAEVWSDGRRGEIAEALRATGASYAEATWERLEPSLDAYAKGWSEGRVAACVAHQSREHDAQVLGLQLACLGRRKAAFDALLGALAKADAKVLQKSIQAADDLPLLATCGDVAALTSAVPPPEDPKVAEEVARLRDALDPARVALSMRRHADGLALTSQVVARADELAYRPLEAEALVLHGRLLNVAGQYDEAIDALSRGLWRADVIRDDVLLAQAMGSLIFVTSEGKGDYEGALRWRPHADAVIERLGPGTRSEAYLLSSFGQVKMRQGLPDEGIALGRRALAISEEVNGADDRRIVGPLNSLGNALLEKGELDEAQAIYERELKIEEASLGDAHPDLAGVVNNLGTVHAMKGELDAALPLFQRALKLEESALGPDHPSLAGALGNIGATLAQQGKLAEARVEMERALVLEEKGRGEDHPMVAFTLHNLASLAQDLGDPKAARDYLQRALTIRRAKLPPNAPMTAAVLSDLGWLDHREGRTRAGTRYLEQALKMRETQPEGGPPDVLPTIQFRLAVILRDAGKKARPRADELAAKALAAYKELDPERFKESIATIEGWQSEPEPAKPAKKRKKKKKKKR
ncbi:MAG: serine/threonine protein kinase [Myxococcales bacterium]|nr:serine/threonine protein kinase [Myxococcales bacterium]